MKLKFRIPLGCNECRENLLNKVISYFLMGLISIESECEVNLLDLEPIFHESASIYNIIYFNEKNNKLYFSQVYDRKFFIKEINTELYNVENNHLTINNQMM